MDLCIPDFIKNPTFSVCSNKNDIDLSLSKCSEGEIIYDASSKNLYVKSNNELVDITCTTGHFEPHGELKPMICTQCGGKIHNRICTSCGTEFYFS